MGYKGKTDPGDVPSYGAIFMSNAGTKKECFQRKLLGLPLAQSNFVLNVKKGMILFLFEFERRQLHGVFRATSNGEIDIEPNAFKSSGKSFPAQVRFAPVWKCNPLSEHEFKVAIKENYFSWKKFNFGLSKDQVYKLVTLFHSKRIPKKPSEGDARRFGDYRNTIRDRVREGEVKEIDDQGYKYNRIQDEYNVISSFDRGYFGHNERVEREERTLTEQHPQYEPRGTDYDEDFGFGDVNVTSLSHINQNNSDFIPVPQVSSEQFQHPFNIGNTYESCLPYLTSGDPSVITLHTPYNPEVPDFCHRPYYDPEVPEFCHKHSYFTPGNPVDIDNHPPFYPDFKSETASYHYHESEKKGSDVGFLRSQKKMRKVSVFDRLTKAPEVVFNEEEHERDEKDDELDASVNKVMKMLEKIVSSPIKRSGKRQSSFKHDDDDDDDNIRPKKIVDYDLLPNTKKSIQFEEGDDESVVEETRVVDFKRRKKINKNLDDESKKSCSKRKKLVRPVFVEKELSNTNTPLKNDCCLRKIVGEKRKKTVESSAKENGNDEKCEVLEGKVGVDDMAGGDSLKDEKKCGWVEG
ncbi:unnamed protein product [Lactuca saligna]|uniref:DCD domain-containing protein n=1 Tax=Lactuca saligna TaxID=75948 RepID=A0AA35Y944_LACSI|nr:unnamed protein product [Lactuca saligna]